MASHPITTTILNDRRLKDKAARTHASVVPELDSQLTAKERYVQVTIKNETQFKAIHKESYFSSGLYFASPSGFDGFSSMTFSASTPDYAVYMGGATGAASFALQLDASTEFNFSIGFGSPTSGFLMAAVIESADPQDGYDAASKEGNAIESQLIYKGTDESGKEAAIKFRATAVPGQRCVVIIKEVRV